MSIYENIKMACKENGTTVHALESKLGFPRSSICKWDINRPSIDKVKAVADALKKSVDSLLE